MKKIQTWLAGVASTATKRISGQFNPLALGVSRALAVFGKTFLGVSGFSFLEGQDIDKLAGRSVKRMQRFNEERKEKALEHRHKEIEMLAGIHARDAQQFVQQHAAAVTHEQSFCSRIAHEKLPAITLQGESLALRGGDKDWGDKVSNGSHGVHTGAIAL